MKDFFGFLNDKMEESFRTYCKLPLYPPIEDAIGQYPPLYAAARAADFVYYFEKEYGPGGINLVSKNGLVMYHDKDPRVTKHHRKS